MIIKPRVPAGFLLAAAVGFLGAQRAISQESAKSKDDALDSLIEQLAKPAKPDRRNESTKTADPGRRRSQGDGTSAPRSKTTAKESAKAAAGQSGKAAVKKPASGAVAPKDQELDSLLEKLGETKDTPSSEDRPSGPGGSDEPKQGTRPDKPNPPKLGGKDKDIDERLEEYTGRRKKRPGGDEKRSGPVGEIIKEMRDVEQRLAKPDTSGDTQNRQKQIVKRIETLIELVQKSGGQAMGFRVRRVRQPGQQGQQPGDQTGALARGAPDEARQADRSARECRQQGRLGPSPPRAAPGHGEQLQGSRAGHEGGVDQPLFPLGVEREAGPGGVTR